MAEAEDVITDVARHATVFTQALWQRHKARAPARPVTRLADVAPRLDLLIEAVFGTTFRLRTAQLPPRPTLLARTFQREAFPRARVALPSTDGRCIWLPPETGLGDTEPAMERFRTLALVQAMRASRGSAAGLALCTLPLVLDIYLLMEACAADAALVQLLPGMKGSAQRRARGPSTLGTVRHFAPPAGRTRTLVDGASLRRVTTTGEPRCDARRVGAHCTPSRGRHVARVPWCRAPGPHTPVPGQLDR